MTAQAKSCGSCSMCCKLLTITPLDKPAGRWCGHVVKGKGCGIYEDRPSVCRSFRCEWIDSRDLGPEWRPEVSRFVMIYTERRGRLSIVVDPAWPLAWRKEPYYSFIKRLSERTHDGFQIIVCISDRRIVVFPHEDVDLGVVNPEHRVISGWALRDGERAPYAMVLSDVEPEAPATAMVDSGPPAEAAAP